MGVFAFVLYVLVLCRLTVAATFILSASWKLVHRASFDAVLAGSSRRFRGGRKHALGPVVAAVELAVAVALVVSPTAWIPSVVAEVFLLAFSVFLARAESLANGCGCWRPPQNHRESARPYLVRNGILVMFTAIGAFGAGGLRLMPWIAVAALAILPALFIMEIPSVAAILPRRPVMTPRQGEL
jgi:methylamine utilization protein MauE